MQKQTVYAYDEYGCLDQEFESTVKAAECLGVHSPTITRALSTHSGEAGKGAKADVKKLFYRAGGRYWRKERCDHLILPEINVLQYNKELVLERIYPTRGAANAVYPNISINRDVSDTHSVLSKGKYFVYSSLVGKIGIDNYKAIREFLDVDGIIDVATMGDSSKFLTEIMTFDPILKEKDKKFELVEAGTDTVKGEFAKMDEIANLLKVTRSAVSRAYKNKGTTAGHYVRDIA